MSETPSESAPDPASKPDPEMPSFEGPGEMDRALALVRFLRRECPWDRAQTPETLIPHLLEEAHEVADAIRDGDTAELAQELGDLLLNLAFQIVLGEESGTLSASKVYAALERKMVRRHPHLFGDGERQDWERLKAEDRNPEERVLDGLSRGLDPLTKAHRMQERVAGVGFDWDDHHGALKKVEEELEEVRQALAGANPSAVEEELGDLLFAAVNLARLSGAHGMTVLERANRKFRRRFERLENRARAQGVSLEDAGLERLDQLWEEVKRDERDGR